MAPEAVEGAVELSEAEGEPDSGPAGLLHESLDAYELAAELWERGELDAAFAALDHAYELMASVPPNGDALVAQEKENLRQLISRRVVEIYASRKSAVGDTDRSIPREVNDDVRREIASFQGREREFFLESYRRSGLYRPMIVAELEKAGLPEALSWLPLVESGFKERALSSARAAGLWQFIASTGYRYGLDRSDWIDERLDPEKATRAAIAYLSDLHGLLGDWLTALAAYNCGEGNVLRQIQNQREGYFDQFWDLYARLPQETRRYVPRFLATLAILEDPAKYGFELPEPLAAPATETVQIARAVKLEALDLALKLPAGTVAKLNPELRRNATPNAPYTLVVPLGRAPEFAASVASIPEWKPPKVEVTTHRVRSGETLSQIATRYRTSVSALMSLNRLRSANRLSVGQRLQVPAGRGSASSSSAAASAPATRADVAPGTEVRHRVRSGDSLWLLASRYGTTIERIRSDNNLRGSMLRPGQVLTIRAGSAEGGG
ncbi:MAG: LysM peptidoglycan-binding domain-containing protein [Thermoanaerobaculia bacterium]|nr:MAG: LysM peptidoglycan-binding domain-containing protein [Thermoanaerobaculia bacterium]